jgi:Xaa-Pro aminopeptidase
MNDSFAKRVARAQQRMSASDLDALLVGPSSDLRYLCGYDAPALERLTLLVLPAEGEPTLVLPQLERPRARSAQADGVARLVPWGETEDPIELVRTAMPPGARRAAVGDRLWASFVLRLQAAIPEVRWSPASEILEPLRARKDGHEIDALRRAARIADDVAVRLREQAVIGRTEREVAAWIGAELVERGSDRVGFVIVASGANAASPHHEPSDRVIEPGDALVCDFGGVLDGYCSDITRTFVAGRAPDGFDDAYSVLARAQDDAVATVRGSIAAEDVDAAARDAIDAAGYGDLFVHRTGHGIGLDVHEAPWIVAGNKRLLEPGMTFSIEPGIYAPARFGMRVEDIVVATADGVERLNDAPRDAAVLS